MVVAAAPILPVGTDSTFLSLERFVHRHRNEVRPGVNRCGRDERSRPIALDSDVAAPPAKRTRWQLVVANDRVRLLVITADDLDGHPELLQILFKIINGHESRGRGWSLERRGELFALLERHILVEGVECVIVPISR